MIKVRDDLWLCVDCLFAAVNGDTSGVTAESDEALAARLAAIESGLDRLGAHLVPDFDSETGEGIRDFSRCGCDCCGSRLAGEMHRFAILGEPMPKYGAKERLAWRKREHTEDEIGAAGLCTWQTAYGGPAKLRRYECRGHGSTVYCGKRAGKLSPWCREHAAEARRERGAS